MDGSTEYVLLVISSLPDLHDLVVLELRDAAGEPDEEVHSAEHQTGDERVDTDDDIRLLVLHHHVADRQRGRHDEEVAALDNQLAPPAHARDRA